MAPRKSKPAANASVLDITLLSTIAAAGATGTFAPPASLAAYLTNVPPLVEAGTNADANGNVAVRASQAGIDYLAANAAKQDAPAAAAPAPSNFVFATVELTPAKRGVGGPRQSIWPFDTLPDGQSFFIEATTARPEPAKTLGSTVSSAIRRFAVQSTTQPMKTVTVKIKDAAGNVVKDATGADVTKQESVQNMVPVRMFFLRPVGPGEKIVDGTAWGQPGKVGAYIMRDDSKKPQAAS